jgi:hypothetical protein
MLAVAAVLGGALREEAAKIGGIDRQPLREVDPIDGTTRTDFLIGSGPLRFPDITLR